MFANREQNFTLISQDRELSSLLTGLWPEGVQWTWYSRGRGAIEKIFNVPPDLLIVDLAILDMDGMELVKLVKNENVYRQVPVVVCLEETIPDSLIDPVDVEVDDFLIRPVKVDEVRTRLALTWYRSTRALDANPLTRLPGNTSIIQKIQDLIDTRQDFALGYLDLDHFKAFNDAYGFSRGDEVLMMASRVIVNSIRGVLGTDGFVGHIGGDDFVFIVPGELVELVCQSIIANFNSIVPHFYDPEDRRQGFISSRDRQGTPCSFPLMTLSIAVVFNRQGQLTHFGQASQIAMGLKKKAKEDPSSSYVLDRRRSP